MIAPSLVRVYAERGAYATRPVYGCVEATGRTRRPGPVVPSRAHQVQIPIVEEPYALNAHWFAAYELEGYDIDLIRYVYFSKDIAGHDARRCIAGFGSANGDERGPTPHRPFLAADGNFAWVGTTNGSISVSPPGRRSSAAPGPRPVLWVSKVAA